MCFLALWLQDPVFDAQANKHYGYFQLSQHVAVNFFSFFFHVLTVHKLTHLTSLSGHSCLPGINQLLTDVSGDMQFICVTLHRYSTVSYCPFASVCPGRKQEWELDCVQGPGAFNCAAFNWGPLSKQYVIINCLLRASCLHRQGKQKVEKEVAEKYKVFFTSTLWQ